MNTHNDITFLGVPSTIVSWMAYLNIVDVNPLVNFVVSIFSLVWLSIQIYSWKEKRIKDKRNGSK
jgi:formate hydrogenlyase subunit 3/multisubunit Na+/H+ antiporter MnhD subunit